MEGNLIFELADELKALRDRKAELEAELKQINRKIYFVDADLSDLIRISELRALAQKCTVAYGGARVSHTRNVASLEDAVMKIMEAEKELDVQIDLLVDTKKEIESVIERVPDADCRLLLEMRYLAMESWTEIARQMNTYFHEHQAAEKVCSAGEMDHLLRGRLLLRRRHDLPGQQFRPDWYQREPEPCRAAGRYARP